MSRTATVVGSGPNGLAAALALARAGLEVTVLEAADEIGGGTRSHRPFTSADLLVDHCAGFHPMAVGSPALGDLQNYGLKWVWPEIDCAHPLVDDAAGLLHRSVEKTATGLGSDGRRWKRVFGYPSSRYGKLSTDLLGPVVHVPRHPWLLARFGAPTALPAATLARLFTTPQARALWIGAAAHAMRPLTEVFSSAIGAGILTAGHHNGWPVAEGGTSAISQAMHHALLDHGASVQTGTTVTSRADLPTADVTLFDTSPTAVTSILGEALPSATRRSYGRFQYGPAAFKVDIAVRGGVPWSDPRVAKAGTVHVGGSADEIVTAEADVAAGRMPDRPFVLVGQQYVADPQRADGDVVPVYAYAHVPAGLDIDITEAVIERMEQFAPGLRSRVIETVTTTPNSFSAGNANFVDGDILCGASSPTQLLLGPRPGRDPYRTGTPGHYLCSAAAPPGPGAHGMAGLNAARRALHDLNRH
ncbi:Dehydrogenase [Rhodococcus sp. AW25M09]|uniref:phytoene desaturase family protein n=1 Tax=Rhodococcus sp. AW25M09 TaxID=1268303 RepID=UPI0002ABDBB7|nr:NAD(P)/FAD-dependent oxidoreductase [Rhodococcus sp. AW25M09]CCQ13597.1 Dehydrogenase [Rhodococcus sp. AW25M09]